MTVAAPKSRLTAGQFMALPESDRYELIDGQLVERTSMGAYASYVAAQILHALHLFVDQHGVGWLFDSEAAYRCFASPDTIRKCDVSLVKVGRFEDERIPDGYINIAPDLAVEVISPSNLAYEVQDKITEYSDVGIPLIWIVYPNTRHVQVYERGELIAELDESDTITGGSVLPGFSWPVSRFFQPTPAAKLK